MAQIARPISDVQINLIWTTTPLWSKIDDTNVDSAADADFIETPDNTVGADSCLLSSVEDPGIHTNHIVSYRYSQSASGGNQRTITIALMQGGSVIATGATHSPTSATWVTGSFTLTTTEAGNITNYSDLRIRFDGAGTTGGNPGNRRSVRLSVAQLSVPDATVTHQTAPSHLQSNTNLSQPSITQKHIVTPSALASNTNLSQSILFQTSSISPQELQSNSNISQPTLLQIHQTVPDHLQASINLSQPTILQSHFVTPQVLQTETKASSPTLLQTHNLTSDSVEASTNLSSPTLSQTHLVAPSNLAVDTNINAPFVGVIYNTAPNNLSTASGVSSPTLLQTYVSNPDNLVTGTNLSLPVLFQTHLADSDSLASNTNLSSPTLTHTYKLFPNHLQSSTNLSLVSITQLHIVNINALEISTGIFTPSIIEFTPPDIVTPVEDLHVGNWRTNTGATTNLFDAVNEAIPDDGDFIRSEDNPTSSPVVFRFNTADTPTVNTGHKIRIRTYRSGPANLTLIPQWRTGYVSEASPGILIYEDSPITPTEEASTYEVTVPELDAADIPNSDYGNGVQVRLVAGIS